MSACREIGRWITEEVRKPFEEWVSTAEEKCSEARRWVEREVRRPIERQRERVERDCRRRPCKWWCLCCNRWFCWVYTVIVRIIEWIVELVGEWLVELVCRIVVRVIKIIVEIVITVVKFVVVGLVCLFSEPRGALDALIDFWYDLTGVVSDVGDLVGDVLVGVSDLLDIAREFVLDIGDSLGPIGRFFFGIIAGVLDIARRVVDGARRIVDGVFEIVIGILHLDFCAALEGLVNGVGFGLGQALLGVLGVTSLASNGVRDGIVRAGLRDWIQRQLNERFKGERRDAFDSKLKIDSSAFGVSWPVIPLRCAIPSRSDAAATGAVSYPLRELHEAEEVNLYKIAGYAPFGCDETPVKRSVYELVYRDTEYRVSVADLRAYLGDEPESVPEFELVAGNRRVVNDMLLVAKRKMRQMAIHLDIRPLDNYRIGAGEMLVDDLAGLTLTLKTELKLRDLCDLPAMVVFGYEPKKFGLALSGTRTIATVRASFMAHLFGTVLAHEMGHCFSLEHEAHDGMEHIMYTMDESADLDTVTGGTVIEYLMIGGEPYFTLQDGKDAWNWILEDALDCLGVKLSGWVPCRAPCRRKR